MFLLNTRASSIPRSSHCQVSENPGRGVYMLSFGCNSLLNSTASRSVSMSIVNSQFRRQAKTLSLYFEEFVAVNCGFDKSHEYFHRLPLPYEPGNLLSIASVGWMPYSSTSCSRVDRSSL